MNSLKIPLNQLQLDMIVTELERLFLLQDKQFGESKKNIFMQEIEDTGFPFQAIIAGIRKLTEKDLRVLKLFTIKQSIKNFIVYSKERSDCCYCRGYGTITMVNDNRNSFAFACRCAAGTILGKEYPKWNGESLQEFNGENYTSSDSLLLGNKYEKWVEASGKKTIQSKTLKEMNWE